MAAIAVAGIVMGGMEVADAIAVGEMTFATVAAIGAIAGGIGTLTGNKTLTQIGMVMGAVGGVGALASSAGMFGNAATMGDAESFGAGSAGAGSTVADTAAVASGAVANPLSEVQGGGTLASAAPVTPDGSAFDALPASVSGDATTAAAAPVSQPGILNTGGGVASSSTQNPLSEVQGTGALKVNSDGTFAGGVFDGLKKIGGGIVDTLNQNKGLAQIVGQMGAGALASLSPKTAAETQLIQSQTALNTQTQTNRGMAQPTIVQAGGTRPSIYTLAATSPYMQPGVSGSVANGGLINSGVTGQVA